MILHTNILRHNIPEKSPVSLSLGHLATKDAANQKGEPLKSSKIQNGAKKKNPFPPLCTYSSEQRTVREPIFCTGACPACILFRKFRRTPDRAHRPNPIMREDNVAQPESLMQSSKLTLKIRTRDPYIAYLIYQTENHKGINSSSYMCLMA